MLLDKSPNNNVLFSYLKERKGIRLSKKNPYYCIANICLRKIKTSHVSRYGLALLHILHNKISIKDFKDYFRANGVTELSRKGSALHSKLKPNPQQAYDAGVELLEDEEFLVKVPRKKTAEKNCYVLYIAKVKKGDTSDYILKKVAEKTLVEGCIKHFGMKHLGK